MTRRIGAAEQVVHNNNNKLITQRGESQTKLKKVQKSFEKVLYKFKTVLKTVFKIL